MPEDYTRSRSRKQWTDRTEGILKNIIDKLWESTVIPGVLINVPEPVTPTFILTADVSQFDLVKGVGGTVSSMIMAESIGSWYGTVNLTVSHNLCSGASYSLGSSSLILDQQHPIRATRIEITIPTNCPVGTYKVTITGTGDSITRSVTITINVGSGIPPPGKECTSDLECQQLYGADYYCVEGECRKECGDYAIECNSDRCPPGQKCIWNAPKGKCACFEPDFDLSCPSLMKVYRNNEGEVKGTITVTSRYGFADQITFSTRDVCQPECMKCIGYNVSPAIVNLIAGGSTNTTLTLYAHKCPELKTYYLEITASGGGKTHRCTIAIQVISLSGGGLGYFRFAHTPGPGRIVKVEFFLNAARTQKFAEHTFTTYWDGVGYRSDCFFFNMPSQSTYWWKATKLSPLGEGGIIYFYHCYNNICSTNNWGFCSGGTGWSYEDPYYVWYSQCSCGDPCTNPTCVCMQECGECPS
jgi:hypothetical protein